MPATNIPLYVPVVPDVVPLWNTVLNINTATPIETDPGTGRDPNTSLSSPVYYLNNEKADVAGYIFIPLPSVFNPSSSTVYIHDEIKGWTPFNDTENTFSSSGLTPVISNGTTYNVFHFGDGSNAEDLGWIPTRINVSFVLSNQ